MMMVTVGACSKDNADKKVLAKVGSAKIVQSDVQKELETAPPAYKNYLSTMEGKKQFLDVLIKEKVLMNAADKAGVAQKDDIKKRLQAFTERMKKQEEDFRKNVILREYLHQLQTQDLKVTEADIKGYYDQNKAEFDAPLTVSASHILTPTQAEAEQVLQRLQKGETFTKVAQEVSKDPSAARGGFIGDFRKGDLSDLPEFESALFALAPGTISGVVKTKIGFHIIRKDKESHLAAQSLAQSTAYIRRVLEKKKFDEWMEKEKKSQNVSIDEQALSSLKVSAENKSAEDAALPEEK